MTFIATASEAQATGAVAAMYRRDRELYGVVPNFTRAFSLRPEVYAAWRQLNQAIKANMDPRRYELATLAAARRLRSSYCALAHGSVLSEQFLDPDTVRALVNGDGTAALDPADRAVMQLADRATHDATSVTEADIDRLRSHGLTDGEILDVVLTAAARCFFSTTLDALGVAPDAKYGALESGLRDALTVGRPIAAGPPESTGGHPA